MTQTPTHILTMDRAKEWQVKIATGVFLLFLSWAVLIIFGLLFFTILDIFK